MKLFRKWWTVPVIMIVLTISVWFWPMLKVYLAPKAVLSSALTNMYSALDRRMQNSPIVLIGKTIDIENGNTIQLNLNTHNNLPKAVLYDMTVTAKWNPKQFTAQGKATTSGRSLDLSLYLDGKFAAVSSADILGGNFYGLNYETFPQDIRSNRIISLIAGEDILNEWETDVLNLQSFMAQSYTVPTLSVKDMRNIFVGILALKAEVNRKYMDIEGIGEDCFVISFETTGSQILSGLDYMNMDVPIRLFPNDEVDVSFWLRGDHIVKIEIEAGEREMELSLAPMPISGDIQLRYEENGEALSVYINTKQNTSSYQETITISGSKDISISYFWNLSNGDLTLNTNVEGEKRTTSLNLSAAEKGIRLETSDIEELVHLLIGSNDTADSPCTMIVTKGAEITTPAYKNFSEWSLEDLMTLFTGVGSLLGLNIG